MSPREKAIEKYRDIISRATDDGTLEQAMKQLCLQDLFFLLIYVLGGAQFANNDWVFDRCREFGSDRDGYIDLWPRAHYKTTIITTAAVIQEILLDPEITIGLFSFSRPISKGFLRAIKTQFEQNERLKDLFPDILWRDPQKEAPKWSEDDGIVVKRKGMPKEQTIEAWGLVDGQPTSKHYALRIYDDMVSRESVTTPEMIAKVTEAFGLSMNLGPISGGRMWIAGTRYHMADTYSSIIKNKTAKLRIYAATKDGTIDGEPWVLSRQELAKKIRDMGTYVASCQLFNNPVMEGEQTFMEDWVQYWIPKMDVVNMMNIYILVDPANSKTKKSDYTVILVIGLGKDNNYYLIDGLRDKLKIKERAQRVFSLHAQYKPRVVGYEKYGIQTDIDFIEEMMVYEQYRFRILPLGGSMSKNDRIKRLQPLFESRRFYLPEKLIRVDYQGKAYDLTQSFLQDEYLQFPYMTHDDMLDCMARITDPDLDARFPMLDDKAFMHNGLHLVPAQDEGYNFNTFDYLKQASY